MEESYVVAQFLILYLKNVSAKFLGTAGNQNGNKLINLFLAQRIGLNIPKTLATNVTNNIKDLSSNLKQSFIVKALSQPLQFIENSIKKISYTSRLTKKDIEDEIFPALFQEEIKKLLRSEV